MSEQIKLNKEEIDKIELLQQKFQEKIGQFGKLYLEKMDVEETVKVITSKEDVLQKEWESLKSQEDELVQGFLKSYGEGTIDLKNGVFYKA